MATQTQNPKSIVRYSSAQLLFRDSYRTQAHQIDTNIAVCGVSGRMAQDVSNGLNLAPTGQQSCGKCVAHQVKTSPPCSARKPRALSRFVDDCHEVILNGEGLQRSPLP